MLPKGLLFLAITYLTAVMPQAQSTVRKAMMWIGGIALIPLTVFTAGSGASYFLSRTPLPGAFLVAGWGAALALPLAVAIVFRRTAAWMNLVAGLWVILLGTTSLGNGPGESLRELGFYAISAVGAIGLIGWRLAEARKERINLGVAGFALSVLGFYFSTVMDKMERSASLISMGILFLVGGWLLEKTRRRLVEKLQREVTHEPLA